MKPLYTTLMIICLIISGFFIYTGIKIAESAVQEASAAGFACFFGIIARILQAETHQSE